MLFPVKMVALLGSGVVRAPGVEFWAGFNSLSGVSRAGFPLKQSISRVDSEEKRQDKRQAGVLCAERSTLCIIFSLLLLLDYSKGFSLPLIARKPRKINKIFSPSSEYFFKKLEHSPCAAHFSRKNLSAKRERSDSNEINNFAHNR